VADLGSRAAVTAFPLGCVLGISASIAASTIGGFWISWSLNVYKGFHPS
jgi:hypothetical protein